MTPLTSFARSRQSGMSLIGFLFALVFFGFFAYSAMKLVPAYTEFMGVKKTVKEIAAKPGEYRKPVSQIRNDMSFAGSFQYVDNSTMSQATLRIRKGMGGPVLVMSYQKVIPYLYNISFLLKFKTSAPMNTSGG